MRGRFVLHAVLICVTAVFVGFSAAKLRTLSVSAPQLAKPLTGMVEGVVLSVEARDGGGGRIIVRPVSIRASPPGFCRPACGSRCESSG